jgi:glutaredoxin 3
MKHEAYPVGLVARDRCHMHGLLVATDGRCARCSREDANISTRRSYRIAAAVAVSLLLFFVGFRVVSAAREALLVTGASAASGKTANAAAPNAGPRLVIYSTGGCPYCRRAKAWLDESGVAYEEKRVDEGDDSMREMQKLGSRIVPTFTIDGEIVSKGFDQKALDEALRDRGIR